MFDWVSWLLKAVYLYGHLVGVTNFEFDWNTGRVLTTRRSTFYALTHNVLVVTLIVIYWSRFNSFNGVFNNANQLHQYVFVAMVGLETIAGLTILLNRWRHRCQTMNLAKRVINLYRAKPQVKRMIRFGLLAKVIIALSTDFLQVIISLGNSERASSGQLLGMGLQFTMATIVNLAISQNYLAMLVIRANYQLLNSELEKVVRECKEMSYHSPRNGVFMTRCCYLADQLDDIGRFQSQLQSVVKEVGDVFDIQGLMVYGGYYMGSVAFNYLTFSVIKHGSDGLDMSAWTTIGAFLWWVLYFLDALMNLFSMLFTLDDHQKMIRQLEERTVFAPGLDVRLEESFENLQYQLIRNPFKLGILNLFFINRKATTAMMGSVIMHSIYLIQYDMENF
ncbi:hypothetical protein KR009_008647 [Drosophila setifemur]|nr:hypothetical protein KR009_008647 [Drosophila setifemur]